jgi:hypothetical protein
MQDFLLNLDMSVKEAYETGCEEKASARIKRSDVLMSR